MGSMRFLRRKSAQEAFRNAGAMRLDYLRQQRPPQATQTCITLLPVRAALAMKRSARKQRPNSR